MFYFHWGDPDYVREYILNFNKEKTAGFYIGSDGYTWGRVHTSRDSTFQGKLEFEKHWYAYMLWGRLAYNPNLSNELFNQHLAVRFPEAPSNKLFLAWQSASKIIPQVTRFFWRDWDFMWYPEGCKSGKFFTINDFINGTSMEESGILTIHEYVDLTLSDQQTSLITPLEVAENLSKYANEALTNISNIKNNGNAELPLILNDIRAFAHLGNYYSEKIKAATHAALFDANADSSYYTNAMIHINKSLDYWKLYAQKASSQYYPQKLARTQRMDWNELTKEVEKDILLVKNRSIPLSASISVVKNGAEFTEGQNLDVTVKVEPTSGIAYVELYMNEKLIGKKTAAPYEWGYATDPIFKNIPAGKLDIRAKVKANNGEQISTNVFIKAKRK